MAGRNLQAERIIETVDLLCRRIHERFPDAGLNKVCQDLLQISQQAQRRSRTITRPMYGVRILSLSFIVAVCTGFAYTVSRVNLPQQPLQAGEFIQVLEAGFNALVLIGAAILFFVTLETRVKRQRAMRAVHELRSLVHIIDMHQLTKDPERTLVDRPNTASSPRLNMTRFQLNRYLDYCSEMLDLTGKIAALYVDHFPDAQAVAAVNDLESMASSMARKVWQKIMILHNCSDKPTFEDLQPVVAVAPAHPQPASPIGPGPAKTSPTNQ